MQQKFILPTIIWLSVSLFYCYQYILRILPNIIMPELTQKFSINAVQFGSFASIYYLGYVIAHLPLGIAFNRYGEKIVLPSCIFLTSLGLIPIVFTNNWVLVIIGRLLIGIGSSGAVVGGLQIFRNIFTKNFSQMFGAMASVGLFTVVYAATPLLSIIKLLGINTVIYILIISGMLLSIICYFILNSSIKNPVQTSILSSLKIVLGNPKLIILGILAGLMVGPLEGFSDAWGNIFLNQVCNIDRVQANSIISKIFIGMGIGCFIIPYIAEKTNFYYLIIIAAATMMTGCFLLLPYTKDVLTLNVLCFIIGVSSSYQIIAISKAISFIPNNVSATGGAVTNMIIMAFGALFHTLIGFIINSAPLIKIEDGVKIYSASTYISAVSVIPIALIIAVMGLSILALYDKYAKKAYNI